MWDCTSVLKGKKQVWPCKEDNEQRRRWREVGEGMRGQAVEELHQDLISWTPGSNSWSDTSFLSATMQTYNRDSDARADFVSHENTDAA